VQALALEYQKTPNWLLFTSMFSFWKLFGDVYSFNFHL